MDRLRWQLKSKLVSATSVANAAAFRTLYIGEILFGNHYPAASRVYRAERYDGHAVLIHTGKRGGFDPETTWRELVPVHLINYLVSGEHLEILKEPLIGVIGGHLRICLQETQLATK